jgi:AP-2 complex subunit mu-1
VWGVAAWQEHGRSRVECQVQIKSTYGAKLIALGVIVRIPVPPETAKATINISIGKAKYNASESCIVWKVRTPTD